MKTIKLISLIILVFCSLQSHAGDIKYMEVNNGVIVIGSKTAFETYENLGFYEKNSNTFLYNLELYSNGNIKQYAIKASLFYRNFLKEDAYSFPSKSKMLLKLEDDSVIELKSIIHQNITDLKNEDVASAYFPISEVMLNNLFNGVKKIRIEIIKLDKKSNTIIKDYRDIEFKKDKVGKKMKEWYDEINDEFENNGLSLLSKSLDSNKKMNDITEGF